MFDPTFDPLAHLLYEPALLFVELKLFLRRSKNLRIGHKIKLLKAVSWVLTISNFFFLGGGGSSDGFVTIGA